MAGAPMMRNPVAHMDRPFLKYNTVAEEGAAGTRLEGRLFMQTRSRTTPEFKLTHYPKSKNIERQQI